MTTLTPEEQKMQRARLRAEMKAPARILRLGIYGAFAAMGLIGTLSFLSRALATIGEASFFTNFLWTLAHVGLIAAMVSLYRLEKGKDQALYEKFLAEEQRR